MSRKGIWNLRLELGHVQQQPEMRRTRLVEDAPLQHASVPAPPEPKPDEPIEEEVVECYGPVVMAQEWAKARGPFSGKDFVLLDEVTVRCPAGKILRARSRVPLANGDVRIAYGAKIVDCRSCSMAQQCIGRSASGDKPRPVSGVCKYLGPIRRPKAVPWQERGEQHDGSPLEPPCELLWCDVGGRAIRRNWFRLLRGQQVNIEEEEATPIPASPRSEPQVLTRAQRAHARLSWQERQARNGRTSSSTHFRITLFGVAPHVADYLNLASISTGG